MRHIYGLFDTAGECHYVGCTGKPQTRALAHSKKSLGFCVLRTCHSKRKGQRLEKQIMRAYKRMGKCELNTLYKRERGPKNKDAVTLGRLGGLARSAKMTDAEKSAACRKAALARHASKRGGGTFKSG